jgi:hypothetical protein
MVLGQPGKKLATNKTNKPKIVAYTCGPSYAEGIGSRIAVLRPMLGKNIRPYPKNNCKKRVEACVT